MKTIHIFEEVGSFAEDKDAAALIRDKVLIPAVSKNESVIIDFKGVTLTTQSFIHALIAESFRVKGEKSLEIVTFKNCLPITRRIIETVVQYVLDTIGEDT